MTHPDIIEELEYQTGPRPGTSAYGQAEAVEGAGWKGEEWNRGRPFLLTMYDQWIRNPHYFGPPGAPWPDEDTSEEEAESWFAFSDAWWKAEMAGHEHPTLTVYAPAAKPPSVNEDDIPF